MKYGLICYNRLNNIGNEIQSIAARRFLPQIDYYLDFNDLTNFDSADEEFKVITNAWYLQDKKSWPPKDKYINPLLVSMHLNLDNKNTIESFLSDESREFLTKYGPVGARDTSTCDWLNKHDIPSYFSGCLTLTLQGEDAPKEDYILLVDVPKELIPFIKSKTDKKIYNITHLTPIDLDKRRNLPRDYLEYRIYNSQEKFYLAENYLKLYEKASCVITNRLHVALPCLAFKTPVMVISDIIYENSRFSGFEEMLRFSTVEEYKNNYNMFDVNNPPENSKNYLKYRKDLIEKCQKFTGHINPTYYSFKYNDNELLKKNVLMLNQLNIKGLETNNKVFKLERENEKLKNQNKKQKQANKKLKKQNKKQKQANKKLKKQNNKKDKKLKEIKYSNSWKMTKPLRKFKKLIK